MSRALVVITSAADRAKAVHWIGIAPWNTRIEFKAPKRSLPQNDRMWAMLTDVAAHMKRQGKDYTTDQWKAIFMHACGKEVSFLPSLDGKTFIPWGSSSSDLSKQEMTDLIEYIHAWGAENSVSFNDPQTSPAPPPGGEGSDESLTPPEAVAADEPADAADGAGDIGAQAEPVASSAPTSLSATDKAFLVRVFKTMKAAVGPDVNTFRNQALIFTDEIGGKSELVREKAKTIRERLQTCCGDNPRQGTVAVAKYLSGIIGVDVKELEG